MRRREREHRVLDGAELAGDVERRLEARPLRLDERRRAGVELVGLLGRHPLEARRDQLVLPDPVRLDEVPAQHAVGARPADARAGRALIVDLPPQRPQVLPRRDLRRRGDEPGVLGGVDPPVVVALGRGDAVEDPLRLPLGCGFRAGGHLVLLLLGVAGTSGTGRHAQPREHALTAARRCQAGGMDDRRPSRSRAACGSSRSS